MSQRVVGLILVCGATLLILVWVLDAVRNAPDSAPRPDARPPAQPTGAPTADRPTPAQRPDDPHRSIPGPAEPTDRKPAAFVGPPWPPPADSSSAAEKAERAEMKSVSIRFVDAETLSPLGDREIGANDEWFHSDVAGRILLPKRLWYHQVTYHVTGFATAQFSLPMIEPDHVVPLIRVASVTGMLRDASGGAVAGGHVRLMPWLPPIRAWAERPWKLVHDRPRKTAWQTETRADGTFRIDGVPTGVVFLVTAARASSLLQPVSHAPLLLEPGKSRQLELQLPGRGSVTGRVVDASGRGVPDLGVSAAPATSPRLAMRGIFVRRTRSARTNENGNFRIDDLTCGPWGLRTRSRGKTPPEARVSVAVAVVEVLAHGQVVRQNLTVYRGLYISGRVRDTDGRPVANALVTDYTADRRFCTSATSDGTGAFRVGPLAPGVVEIRATDMRRRFTDSAPRKVRAGEQGVVLVIHRNPTSEVAGRVVNAETGTPLAARVSMIAGKYSRRRGSGQSTGDDGCFRMQVTPGTFDLVAWAEPGLFGEVRSITLRPGAPVENLEISVHRTGTLRVTLPEIDMRFLRRELHLRVTLADRRYHDWALWTRIREIELPPGSVTIVLEHAPPEKGATRVQLATQHAHVVAGQTTEVVLRVPTVALPRR